jgi:hypothetical protein
MATFLASGLIFPAVPLRKYPLPTPLLISMAVLSRQGVWQHYRSPTFREIILMEMVNIQEMSL